MIGRRALVVALAIASALSVGLAFGVRDAAGTELNIRGYVTDATTGKPLNGVCVAVSVPARCFTRTDAEGFYFVDLSALGASGGSSWGLYFIHSGYHTVYSESFVVSAPVTFNQPLTPTTRLAPCASSVSGLPTETVYLPNVTKTLGGPAGWQTPFIVQNAGTASTQLEVTFSRFLNGQCVVRRVVDALQPGTSFADVPNGDTDLPGDTQFAVVVRSFGAPVVAVVNEHAGSGDRAEALAYTGTTRGATRVSLPNITRRYYGFVTPFIIQNVGNVRTTATARFVSFDGTAPTVTVTRTIDAGKSQFVDPNSEPGLVDGKQYGVTVTSSEPIAVVVNTHNDAPEVANPVAYSTNGIVTSAVEVYGAYAAKNAGGVGRVSTIVVQNLGTAEVTPSIAFLPLGTSAAPQLVVAPSAVPPGGSWAFDPRFTFGTTTPCGAPSSTCLGDGEYSFIARAGTSDGRIAAAVNVISPATAMGYTASAEPATRYYLPNVTRTLCSCEGPTFFSGWTTPILVQGVTASAAQLKWYRFRDGQLVVTQRIDLPGHSALPIDPRSVVGLADDTQYAVVVEGIGGTVNALVLELAQGADNAMAYEGFPDTGAAQLPGPTAAPTPAPTASPVPTTSPGPTIPPFPSRP